MSSAQLPKKWEAMRAHYSREAYRAPEGDHNWHVEKGHLQKGSNWNAQECFREYFQNLVDATCEIFSCDQTDLRYSAGYIDGLILSVSLRDELVGSIRREGDCLVVWQKYGILGVDHMQQNSIKGDSHQKAVGQFGEGFKRASFILVSRGFGVSYEFLHQRWEFLFKDSGRSGHSSVKEGGKKRGSEGSGTFSYGHIRVTHTEKTTDDLIIRLQPPPGKAAILDTMFDPLMYCEVAIQFGLFGDVCGKGDNRILFPRAPGSSGRLYYRRFCISSTWNSGGFSISTDLLPDHGRDRKVSNPNWNSLGGVKRFMKRAQLRSDEHGLVVAWIESSDLQRASAEEYKEYYKTQKAKILGVETLIVLSAPLTEHDREWRSVLRSRLCLDIVGGMGLIGETAPDYFWLLLANAGEFRTKPPQKVSKAVSALKTDLEFIAKGAETDLPGGIEIFFLSGSSSSSKGKEKGKGGRGKKEAETEKAQVSILPFARLVQDHRGKRAINAVCDPSLCNLTNVEEEGQMQRSDEDTEDLCGAAEGLLLPLKSAVMNKIFQEAPQGGKAEGFIPSADSKLSREILSAGLSYRSQKEKLKELLLFGGRREKKRNGEEGAAAACAEGQVGNGKRVRHSGGEGEDSDADVEMDGDFGSSSSSAFSLPFSLSDLNKIMNEKGGTEILNQRQEILEDGSYGKCAVVNTHKYTQTQVDGVVVHHPKDLMSLPPLPGVAALRRHVDEVLGGIAKEMTAPKVMLVMDEAIGSDTIAFASKGSKTMCMNLNALLGRGGRYGDGKASGFLRHELFLIICHELAHLSGCIEHDTHFADRQAQIVSALLTRESSGKVLRKLFGS
uniref:Uncharacterized protein n=1 Tax=Chromera velia CCMP2878 TaxID=1169474 RepID=A0A0G4H2D4_9ALVE|eukprot:Cvel_24389.t1-p1 / transcript=Cvel_24389.t1 / gene=Cvel_24389 / organism=Chromera_velia_CCMP2878 / gene_product=hypothetical protein / transcript_product=hypothetical protein / location=Cvel_scaffold2630:3984-7237(+) / protein_length=837 / sequence_SO=supercontig / SO=protein_coding / is_pseudo=false